MALTQYSPHGAINSAVSFPEYVDVLKLAGGAASSYTIPSGSGFAIITSQAPFYAKIGGTATIPAASVTNGSGSFYVATGMQCKLNSGKALSCVSATATEAIITIGIYRA